MAKKTNPVHPGRIIRMEFMEPYGVTNYAIAKASGLSEAHVGRIVRGLSGITADVALRLEKLFGPSAQSWLNLQIHYDLQMAEAKSGSKIAKTVKRIKLRAMETA